MEKNNIDTVIITENSRYPVKLIIGCLVLLSGVGFGLYQYGGELYDRYFYLLGISSKEVVEGEELSENSTNAGVVTDSYQRLSAIDPSNTFKFLIVPEAGSRITLSEFPLSDEEDISDYQIQSAKLSGNDKTLASFDTVNALQFDNQTPYLETLASHKSVSTLKQIEDEVLYLAHLFQTNYSRTTFKERVPAVVVHRAPLPDPVNSKVSLNYPAGRAVTIFTAGELMSRIDPNNALIYQENTKKMAERGIAYGEYSRSDLEAARELVTKYFNLVDFEIDSGLEIAW